MCCSTLPYIRDHKSTNLEYKVNSNDVLRNLDAHAVDELVDAKLFNFQCRYVQTEIRNLPNRSFPFKVNFHLKTICTHSLVGRQKNEWPLHSIETPTDFLNWISVTAESPGRSWFNSLDGAITSLDESENYYFVYNARHTVNGIDLIIIDHRTMQTVCRWKRAQEQRHCWQRCRWQQLNQLKVPFRVCTNYIDRGFERIHSNTRVHTHNFPKKCAINMKSLCWIRNIVQGRIQRLCLCRDMAEAIAIKKIQKLVEDATSFCFRWHFFCIKHEMKWQNNASTAFGLRSLRNKLNFVSQCVCRSTCFPFTSYYIVSSPTSTLGSSRHWVGWASASHLFVFSFIGSTCSCSWSIIEWDSDATVVKRLRFFLSAILLCVVERGRNFGTHFLHE